MRNMNKTILVLTIISLALLLIGCRGGSQSPIDGDDGLIADKTFPTTEDVVSQSFSMDYYHSGDMKNSAEGMMLIHKKDTFNPLIVNMMIKWGDQESAFDNYSVIKSFDELNAGEYEVDFGVNALIPMEATKLWVEGYDATGELIDLGCVSVEAYKQKSELLYEFQVISDVHISSNSVFAKHSEKAFQDIKTISPNSLGIFVNGDIVDESNDDYYDIFYETYHKLFGNDQDQLLHVGIGNHEFIHLSENAYYQGLSEQDIQLEYQQRLALWEQKTGHDNPYFYEVIDGNYFIFLGTTAMPKILDGNTRADCTLGDEQLSWLKDVLVEADASGKPIYLFSHGSLRDTVSGSLTSLNQTWYGYQLDEENKLRDIIKDYPQIMMFSSHSHWSFESESPYLISDNYPAFFNTGSVGYLWEGTGGGQHYEGGTYENGGSQGLYIYVYEDQVIIKGRQFEASDMISQYWNSCYQVVIPLV